MIKRELEAELVATAREYPVVTVLGPRQSGKTTLVQMTFPEKAYRSLEDPDLRLVAGEDPRGFLASLPEGGILDEIQRVPQLLSYLQGVVDRHQRPGEFILTGSHQPEVHQAITQSLVGRTAVLTLLPLTFAELSQYGRPMSSFELITRGTFPRLHEHELQPDRFWNSYLQTYIERDVRALIQLKDLRRFQNFLTLLAGRVGQLVNYSSLASDVGVSSTTIKDWISVLVASFVVFELPPFFENVGKRVIKSPKLYFVDAGLAAHLVGIRTAEQVERDPLRGGLYENLVIVDALKQRLNRGLLPDLFFYRDASGVEVDLVIRDGRHLTPFEVKSAATFTPEFQRGLASFATVVGSRANPGAVLYNGDERLHFKGAEVLNPLAHDHDWRQLLTPGRGQW